MSREAGKGGVGPGRNGFRRDFQRPDRSNEKPTGAWGFPNAVNSGSEVTVNGPTVSNGTSGFTNPQIALADIERRVASLQQDFTQSLHKVSEKENEKFDLIFSILTELQQRQANLEDAVRALKSQLAGVSQVNGAAQGQSNGQMNGVMVNGQMQQHGFQGVIQTDGTQMFPMTQMVVLSSPSHAAMQYVPISPTGGMHPMIHYIPQGTDMTGNFVTAASQDGGCVGVQSQMPVAIQASSNGPNGKPWNGEAATKTAAENQQSGGSENGTAKGSQQGSQSAKS